MMGFIGSLPSDIKSAVKGISSSSDILKGKKRTKNEVKYAQSIRKKKRNCGEEYTTKNHKIVKRKVFENIDCLCLKKCINVVNYEDRKGNFENFWKLGDFKKQNLFLCGAVERQIIKQRRPRTNEREKRKYSYQYFLSTANSGEVPVCKKFFVDTFKISAGRVNRALNAPTAGSDLRGKMPGSSRKTSEEKLQLVRDHILSFPEYETSRQTTVCKYLDPSLDIRKMYGLYVEKCREDKQSFVNEWTYRKVFNSEFNFQFYPIRKDSCFVCDTLKAETQSTKEGNEAVILRLKLTEHLKNIEIARKSFQKDLQKISENPDCYFAFSFKMQMPLSYPKIPISLAHYKQKLYVYNLTCHNFQNSEVCMYMWDETQASKGPEEIASCCAKHFANITTQKHVFIYSDVDCNVHLALTWMLSISQGCFETLDHKILTSSHSCLPNDHEFGLIDACLKKVNCLYVPDDYYKLVAEYRRKDPFTAIPMTQNHFFSIKPLENVTVSDEFWQQIKWIRFVKQDPYKMFYKKSLDENDEFSVLELVRPGEFKINELYNNPRPISLEKFNDLMALLPYIPPIHQEYFRQLQTIKVENIYIKKEDEL